jgi:hypothetical protein
MAEVVSSLNPEPKSQSSIQDNRAVETHNLQSSEGKLRKPSFSVEVDVITTSSLGLELGNSGSDNLLALQASEGQLKHDLSGRAEVVSSLNSEPKILVSPSKFTNCSLVRCETPSSRYQERRREMDEIEQFLKKDYHFSGFMTGLRRVDSGPERDDWFLDFFKRVYRHHNFKGDQALFN